MAQHFGERIKRMRQERGWTVYRAALLAGIPNQLWYRMEQYKSLRGTCVVTLRKIARIFEVSVDYLIYNVANSNDAADAHAA